MTQNRDAPAYQEYAATILAQIPFRTMTLQDRGLLYTMRLECWVNMHLPQNHIALAKVLGMPVAEVAESLPAVMPFFEVVDGFIASPELENYRAHLAARKNKQSKGGKLGSAITNKILKRPAKSVDVDYSSTPPSTSSSTSRLPRQGTRESLVQPSAAKPSQTQSPERAVVIDPFIADYVAAESCTAEAYAKASGGG